MDAHGTGKYVTMLLLKITVICYIGQWIKVVIQLILMNVSVVVGDVVMVDMEIDVVHALRIAILTSMMIIGISEKWIPKMPLEEQLIRML